MTAEVSESGLIEIFNLLSEIPLSIKEEAAALKRITDLGMQAMKAQACTLVYVDTDNLSLNIKACTGFDDNFEVLMRNKAIPMGSNFHVSFDLINKGEPIEKYDLKTSGQGVANPSVARFFNLNALLSYPLKSEGRLIGYFNHLSSRSSPFTNADKQLLQLFAQYALITIERFEQYQLFDRSSSILKSLSQSLLSGSADDIRNEVSAKACELLQVPISLVWRSSEKQNELSVAAASNTVDQEYMSTTISFDLPGIKQHLSSKSVAYISDVTKPNPKYFHSAEAMRRNWVSLLSAPMHVENQLIGMLDVYTKTPRYFREWEQKLFGAFANQAALAIQRAELLREADLLREQRKQEAHDRIVSRVRKAIEDVNTENQNEESELKEILKIISKQCADVTGAVACAIKLINVETGYLQLRAYYDKQFSAQGNFKSYPFRIGNSISDEVARTKKSFLRSEKSIRKSYIWVNRGIRLQSILSVPILSGDAVIGAVSVGSEAKGAFGNEQKQILEKVVESLSNVIERASLTDSLLMLAEVTQSESLDKLFSCIAHLTRDLMREPVCLLWLLDKNKDGFVVAADTGTERIPKRNIQNLFMSNSSPTIEKFLKRNNPLYVPDSSRLKTHPYLQKLKQWDWKTLLAMPLSVKGRVLGILEVYSRGKERIFTHWHRKQFKTFAVQASIFIEDLTSRLKHMQLNDIMQEMTRARHKEDILNMILNQGLKLVGSNRGWISLYDLKTGELKIEVCSDEEVNPLTLQSGKGITGQALQRGKPILVEDVRDKKWEAIYEEFSPDTRSELAVPISIANAEVRIGKDVRLASKPIGVFNIESPMIGAFTETDKERIWSLTRQLAIILDKLEFDQKLANLRRKEREIAVNPSWEETIRNVSEAITDTLGFEYVNISLVNPEGTRIKSEYVKGIPDNLVEEFKKDADHALDSDDIQARLIKTKDRDIEVLSSRDVRFDPMIYQKYGHEKLIRVFIPMIPSGDERIPIGTVEAGYQKQFRKHIYERDIQILSGFVDYAVRALERRIRGMLDRITHEFRAPIVGIRNNVDYLQKRPDDLAKEILQKKYEDMLWDCEILLVQVQKLEYILGRTRPVPKLTNTIVIRDVIIKTINQLKPLVREKGFDISRIEYHKNDIHKIKLFLDRGKLNQVVYNLLLNSIKYAEDEPSTFMIRISVDENRDLFKIAFKDWGIGIKKEYAEKVFDEGFRTPEAINKANVTGSGLGLTIARKLMTEINGDLVLANLYKPTEFQMVLPKSLREDAQ